MNDPYYPTGAIENGRVCMERLENHYRFLEEEGHALQMVVEWASLKQAFEYMADYLATRYKDGPLDKAWAEINPLGSDNAHGMTEKAKGYNEAIGDVLEIIENLGGQDPLRAKKCTCYTPPANPRGTDPYPDPKTDPECPEHGR